LGELSAGELSLGESSCNQLHIGHRSPAVWYDSINSSLGIVADYYDYQPVGISRRKKIHIKKYTGFIFLEKKSSIKIHKNWGKTKFFVENLCRKNF